jgi:hypothetical protein
VRVPPGVEEDQMPGVWPDNRAVPVHGFDGGSVRVVCDGYFAARAHWVVGEEQQSRQRVGIDMALKTHRRAMLHVEYNAVTIVVCGEGRLGTRFPSEFQELGAVELMEPWQSVLHLVRVHAAAFDERHICGFTR